MIGKRIKGARAASGLSLRALSDAINNKVSAQAIGKYERNEDMPRSGVLIALSRALGVSVDFLLSDDDLELDGVEFRKSASSSAKEVAMIEAKTLNMVEKYLAVESLLNLSSQNWDVPLEAPYWISDPRDAEGAARSLRAAWQLGHDPVPMLAELLEEHGIKVLSLDVENIDGLAAKVRRKDRHSARVIMIKRRTWSERKRFSLAHELGHMVLNVAQGCDPERAANRFAGAFLIPAEVLRQEIGSLRKDISIGELISLKDRFGVSIQALTYRCKDLEIINPSTFGRLFKIYKDRGWRDAPFEEPHSIAWEQEEPDRFQRLCFRALSEGLIGLSRAAELLEIHVRELESRLDFVA
ncbi:helix-turn-helix domain-containing protein [Loktanella sp. M215]|uniref:helix-turn-helix domain-containing protein n=1 Tax=Loktanella sp. M215 TaxID=2675431 RepID=UPI001F470916|nr:XRE family transcriptional regulator [Loktanella sp. M215]MCF7701592.1 ImmA/IrrE family metallo-endopeptidase [Loktanella sp. M215]